MTKIKPKLVLFLEKDSDGKVHTPSMIDRAYQQIWKNYFEIEPYEPQKNYNKSNTVFVSTIYNLFSPSLRRLKDDGYRIIVDNLWEMPLSLAAKRQDGTIDLYGFREHPLDDDWTFLECREFFWYREYFYNTHHELQRPWNPRIGKLALMPIRKPHKHRRLLKSLAKPWLPKMVWSFTSDGVFLPGDKVPFDDRHVDWDWYNITFCSVVSETSVRYGPWLTEKAFKPMAFRHPFLLQACPGTLEYIKSLGFVTFDNIFDESYDQVQDLESRTKSMLANLQRIDPGQVYDRETLERIEHNHARFWDHDLVNRVFFQRVIQPALDYATT